MENNIQNNIEMKWSVMSVWNGMNKATKEREAKIRDYISPSDLGKDYWGRYQKMMGVPETNPFEERVLRIFSAGDEFHHLIKNVFRACGILLNTQDEPDKYGKNQWSVIPETSTTLKVLGKYDILAGGVVDLEQTRQHCKDWGFSDFIAQRTIGLAEEILKKYPEGLPELLYEVKSINSMAFWNKKDYLQEIYPWHQLQCYAYLKANNLSEGRVLYISKDDLTTAEFPIYYPTERLEKSLQEDLKKMTYFIEARIEPPKPEYIVFNKRGKIHFQKDKKRYKIEGCYEPNWEVIRSLWFKKMTGFDNQEDWESSIKGKIADKNSEIKAEYIEKKLKVKDKKI